MERIKRAVSLILCFVMVFGLLPMHRIRLTAHARICGRG